MTSVILFDTPESARSLMPLTFTRPAARLRVGIMRISAKWQHWLGDDADISYISSPWLDELFPCKAAPGDDNLFIAGNSLPDAGYVGAIKALRPGDALVDEDGGLLAFRGTLEAFRAGVNEGKVVAAVRVKAPQDIFMLNDAQLRVDFELLTRSRRSEQIPAHCTVIGDPAHIFVEEGARLTCAVLNATEGPIYIGRNAEVMEGVCLRGPVALCHDATFKMGAKVYGATTIGPHCKVGGEIGNVVMLAYSNKAHDGYLGNAVIGEWCNLGAGCVSSNLKNDYSLIRLWSYATKRFERTSMQFCGLIMGDHSKAAINTSFNTATVVGVGCNIHGAGFPRTFIPSFSFGGAAGFERVRFNKFEQTARTVMARRHVELTPADLRMLSYLYTLDEYGLEPQA